MRAFFIAAVFLISFGSALADDHRNATSELHALNDQFNELAAAHDMEGMMSLYADKVLWIEPAIPPSIGHDGPRATFQFLVDMQGTLTHTIDHLIISDDQSQAVMVGGAAIKVEKAGLDATGTYLFTLKHDGENWMIVTDMWHQHDPDKVDAEQNSNSTQ